jgi:PAS domain S-box-containing protein
MNFSEDLYKSIADYSPGWDSWFSIEGNLMWMCTIVESLTGFTVKNCIDSPDFLKMVIYKDDYQEVLTHFTAAMHGSEGHNLESRVNRKDGSITWCSFSWRQMYDKAGVRVGFRVTGYDISFRKEMETAVQISEEKYRLLAENISDVIWIVNMDIGRYTYVSPSVQQLRGYTPQEVLEQRYLDTVVPETADALQKQIQDGLERYQNDPSNSNHHKVIFQQFRKDGSLVWIESTFRFRKTVNGETEAVGISRNVSERKEIEFQLAEKNRSLNELMITKDRFFSIIAHDLRSPLSGFLGITEYFAMECDNLNSDETHQMANTLHKSAVELFALLENLLQWSKMQQGLMSLDAKALSIHEESNQVLSSMCNITESKNINVISDVPSSLIVFADKYMTQSILRNLISNAVKFTNQGGEIHITAKQTTQGMAEISIRDTGIGIDQQNLHQLFSPTAKIVRKGTEGESSSGLGLLLVKQFVERNGGDIMVNSEVNKGSTFSFSLPLSNGRAILAES